MKKKNLIYLENNQEFPESSFYVIFVGPSEGRPKHNFPRERMYTITGEPRAKLSG